MATCPSCGTRYADSQRLCPNDGTVLNPDRTPETAAVGRVLDGKYRLDAFLSRGGMGAVYEATHVMLNRRVAVKLISPHLVADADMVRRFQREARAVTHLNHPNIVRVQDLGQTRDGTLYIAMDLIAGKSLSDIIQAEPPFDAARIAHIAAQIVSALTHAHENGVIHRDLKPQNIMITRRPDGREVATLLDFGIAKTFEVDANTKVTSTGFAVGSPRYMSPEQAGAGPVDARSDIYSVGVILYEMLTGEVPFDDASTPALLVKHLTETPVRPSIRRPERHVSPVLEHVAMRCLEKKPEARFQTAEELLRALAWTAVPPEVSQTNAATRLATPRPSRRQSHTPAVVTPPPAPNWRRYAGILTAIVLVVAAALLVARFTRRAAVPPSAPTSSPPAPTVTQSSAPVSQPATPSVQAAPPEPPATPRGTKIQALVPDRQEPTPPNPKVVEAATPEDPKIAQTPLSRALTGRVRTLLAQRGISQLRFRGATLEMTMRPSRPGRGVTADYTATVYTPAGARTVSGSQQGPAPPALRNAIVEKLASEIATRLAAAP